MYELDAFKVTHVSKYPAPVLSVAISPNAALLGVGMADGQLSVRKHSHNKGPVGGGAPPQSFTSVAFGGHLTARYRMSCNGMGCNVSQSINMTACHIMCNHSSETSAESTSAW